MRTARLWLTGFGVVALIVLAASGATAQQGTPPLTLDRSAAIQAQLAKIDQDRAAFVDEFVTGWTPYVDARVYDVWGELRPVALKVPTWQLYGASLVGDFETMKRILTGREGAGKYINVLSAPQQKVASDSPAVAADLGSYTDSLVYMPISPCRVLDTRGTGARTGMIPAGTSRTFDLTSNAFTKGQGVTGTPCAGLPGWSYFGWAVNITVVGSGGNGWLTAWGYTDPPARGEHHQLRCRSLCHRERDEPHGVRRVFRRHHDLRGRCCGARNHRRCGVLTRKRLLPPRP